MLERDENRPHTDTYYRTYYGVLCARTDHSSADCIDTRSATPVLEGAREQERGV